MRRPRRRSKSGFRTKRASARRTASSGNGRAAAHGRASPPTSAMKAPICSAQSARRAAKAPRSPLPHADTFAMQLHLEEISRHVAEGAHAVLLLDRAGWHTTAMLDMPKNITPIFLPSRSPELNVENIWQYLRANWLSNRLFENLRRHHRRGLRRLAKADRSTRDNYLNRNATMAHVGQS